MQQNLETVALRSCYSKCGPWTSSVTREIVRNMGVWASLVSQYIRICISAGPACHLDTHSSLRSAAVGTRKKRF